MGPASKAREGKQRERTEEGEEGRRKE